MSNRNKKIVVKIIKELAEKNNTAGDKYLDDNIKWNIVGMPSIKGKTEFLDAARTYEIENFTLMNIKNIIAEGDYVVVESNERAETGKSITNNPAYCDIYKIKNGKIEELTTYIVDTSF